MSKINRYKLKSFLLTGYEDGDALFTLFFDTLIIPLPVVQVVNLIGNDPTFGSRKNIIAIPGIDYRNCIFVKENITSFSDNTQPDMSGILNTDFTNDLSILNSQNIDFGALEISGKITFNVQNDLLYTANKYLFNYLEKF